MANISTKLKEKKLPPHYEAIVEAPFGAVGIQIHGVQVAIDLLPKKHESKQTHHKVVAQVAKQVEAYFANPYNDFNFPVVYKGTPFQRRVWQAISAIPKGYVLTYSEIAQQIGSGPRAVANACGANHLPLVIPCHRVVAKDGLGGFMNGADGGDKVKKWLLKHEGITFKNDKPIRPAAFE
jgi:methylated-DNA-[protein]-cysteine S-methyltransferase